MSARRLSFAVVCTLGLAGCGDDGGPRGTAEGPRAAPPPAPREPYDEHGGLREAGRGTPPGPRPDLLLVLLEQGHAAWTGGPGPAPEPPTGWSAAVEGAGRFANAATAALHTLPALASVLTARLPSEHGLPADGSAGIGLRALPTAAEILGRSAGYRTRALIVGAALPAGPGSALEGFGEVRTVASVAEAAGLLESEDGPGPRFALVLIRADGGGVPSVGPLAALAADRRPGTERWSVWAALRGGAGSPVPEPEALRLEERWLRVPLALRLGTGAGAQERPQPGSVGLVDLLPTLLEALGLPPLAAGEGRPLPGAGAARASGHPTRAQALLSPGTTRGRADALLESVRSDRWKVRLTLDRRAGTVVESLFDLAADPLEALDLADARGWAVGPAFDEPTCRAIEAMRDRVAAALEGAALLQEHAYEAGTGRIEVQRPPSACAPAPGR